MKYTLASRIQGAPMPPMFFEERILVYDNDYLLRVFDVGTCEKLGEIDFKESTGLYILDNVIYGVSGKVMKQVNIDQLTVDILFESQFGAAVQYTSTYLLEQGYKPENKLLRLRCSDRFTSEVFWDREFTNHRWLRRCEDFVFLSDISLTYFTKFDLATGEEVWTHTLPEGERVTGDLFTYGGWLFIQSLLGSTPNATNFVQALDTTTGQLVWRRQTDLWPLKQDPATGRMYFFGREHYVVLEPTRGEVVVERQFPGLEANQRLLVPGTLTRFQNGGLYFMGSYVKDYYVCQFGKINVEAHEIEFLQKLDVPPGVSAEPPLYHQGRLYIKDSVDTLHIYAPV